MSLFNIYKAKTLGVGAGSLFDAKAGGKLNKDAWKKGFNKWDEEWRTGFYNASTGAFQSNANYIANKNLIPISSNAKYYFQAPSGIVRVLFFYDANGDFVSRSGIGYEIKAFDTPSDCSYMAFYMDTPYGTSYKNDICINISGEHDGEYVPYDG